MLCSFDDDGILIFLRDQHARCERATQHVDEEIIGDIIELLHFLALDVGRPRHAVEIRQTGLSDGGGDGLDGREHGVEQLGQLSRGVGESTLLLDDVTRQRHAIRI